jgi:large subunit ribosomal protein L25
MHKPVIAARVRKQKGKGAARKLRKNNQIPAIFYGPKTEPIMLTVDYPELEGIIKQGTGENIIVDLQVQSDQGTDTRKAMLKDLLVHPTKDTYLHADFYEISMDKEITVGIPIHLTNTPKGVQNGGVLQHVQRELMVSCLPDKLIDALDIDVSGLDIGDSLRLIDIALPEGIRPAGEPHLTIAVVASPAVTTEVAEEEEEKVEEESAEPETERVEES